MGDMAGIFGFMSTKKTRIFSLLVIAIQVAVKAVHPDLMVNLGAEVAEV